MHTLNLGILAHVDAGKTSLTERLLYAAGVIGEVGSVDKGSTQTDTLALERQRGITIKSAVVSFTIGGVTVNLIDTPGHPDFIAEVERVLGVLDGAVLVISAVEGVQAQTRILMRALRRLRIPVLIFVNKIDRRGARGEAVLAEITARLGVTAVPMGVPAGLGTRAASVTPLRPGDPGGAERLAAVLAEHDDGLLAAYLAGPAAIGAGRLRRALAAQTAAAQVCPAYFGSAITGAGTTELADGIARLLPATSGDPAGPLSGTVFKVERGPGGEKIACARLFSGTVRTRGRLSYGSTQDKVTAIGVYDGGPAARRPLASAGQIARLWGLAGVRIGDTLGAPPPGRPAAGGNFAPPTLETVVVPDNPADMGALHAALTALAEQDPLINLRQDDSRQELRLSLYGEVQKEVIQATLATDFGVRAGCRESLTIHVERLLGAGAAVERMSDPGNPFLATIGLRLEPAAEGSGVEFGIVAELGSMPLAFFRTVEATVRESFREGLHGWQVTDCSVTMTDTGFLGKHGLGHQRFNKSMSSTGEDFRGLTPLIVFAALARAGTVVCEPVDAFRLELPADCLTAMLAMLAKLGATPGEPLVAGASCALEGEIPAGQVHYLRQRLLPLTRGEGMLDAGFSRYRPVAGAAPRRPRTTRSPLERREYLLEVQHGVRGG